MPGGAPHTKTGTSWTKSHSVAKNYTEPGHRMYTMKIDRKTPAIDVNKLLKGNASDSDWGRREKEVFVAKGKYKTKATKH